MNDIKEIHISSKFYSELLQWWSAFRSVFDSRREYQYIFRNNKEIRFDNKPVFYKKLFEQDVIFVNDLLFELDTTNSFTIVSNKISKINYLIWEGLRHSVPKHLKNSNCLRSEISLILTIDNKEFDILEKKSKDYYGHSYCLNSCSKCLHQGCIPGAHLMTRFCAAFHR